MDAPEGARDQQDVRQPPARPVIRVQRPDRLQWQPIFPNPAQPPAPQPPTVAPRRRSRLPAVIGLLVLLMIGASLAWAFHDQMGDVLSRMGDVVGSNDPADKALGLVAIGLLGAVIVGVVRVVTHEGRHDR